MWKRNKTELIKQEERINKNSYIQLSKYTTNLHIYTHNFAIKTIVLQNTEKVNIQKRTLRVFFNKYEKN